MLVKKIKKKFIESTGYKYLNKQKICFVFCLRKNV